MAAPAPVYDLMLLLDPKAEDATREKIRADVRAMIEAAGTIENTEDYGARPLAYEIDHQGEAEYELLQFQGPTTLLDQLNRTLHITDGVVRFRIIKVRPGTPGPPDLRRAAAVEAAGTIENTEDYGTRALAYEIEHQGEAEYELLQFQGPTSVLDQLNRTLHITDGVVRFRIIKVRPGTPGPPDLRRTAAVEAAEPADADAEPVAS